MINLDVESILLEKDNNVISDLKDLAEKDLSDLLGNGQVLDEAKPGKNILKAQALDAKLERQRAGKVSEKGETIKQQQKSDKNEESNSKQENDSKEQKQPSEDFFINNSKLERENYGELSEEQKVTQVENVALSYGIKLNSEICKTLVWSIDINGSLYESNDWLSYIILDIGTDKNMVSMINNYTSNVQQLYLSVRDKKINLYDDSGKLKQGFMAVNLFNRPKTEFLYTCNILNTLQGNNYTREISQSAKEWAISKIYNKESKELLPAGINTKNGREICIWNVINQAENLNSSKSNRYKKNTVKLNQDQTEKILKAIENLNDIDASDYAKIKNADSIELTTT